MLKSRGYPLTLEASLIKKKIDPEIDNMLLLIPEAEDPSELHPNEYTKADFTHDISSVSRNNPNSQRESGYTG